MVLLANFIEAMINTVLSSIFQPEQKLTSDKRSMYVTLPCFGIQSKKLRKKLHRLVCKNIFGCQCLK